MGVGTAIALAGLAASGAGMARQQTASNYNANLAELEGEQQKDAIAEENERLVDDQRQLRASQRVALATSGADISQTQPLMLLADQANKMSLDRLELQRRGNIAQSRGQSKSLLYKLQGRENLASGIGGLAKSGYNVYQGYKARKST